MRLIIAVAAVLAIAMGVASTPMPLVSTLAGGSFVAAAQQQQPAPKAQVDIDVNRGGGAWWASPTWIAIGVVVLLLVVVIIALAARGGGGTTVIRD